jgi:hypothetical protein
MTNVPKALRELVHVWTVVVIESRNISSNILGEDKTVLEAGVWSFWGLFDFYVLIG